MTAFEKFFPGGIHVVNLARRPDRLLHFSNEMKMIGVSNWQRFEAVDAGKDWGNTGCCASHKKLLDQIARAGNTAFVFEDDAAVRRQFRDSFHMDVAPVLRELPADWDLIYLGGGYGEDPQGWFSKHLIRINGMKTTSSYGITAKAAREISDMIPPGTHDAIDELFSAYCREHNCFICEPRLFVQYQNYSDLQKREMNNAPSMEDRGHVERLGKFHPL